MMVSRLLSICICLLFSTTVFSASYLKTFSAESLDSIVAQRDGKPFILVMWSIDCQPCMQELELLSDMRGEQPKLDVVLVSTDGLELAAEVESVLTQFTMQREENWLFSHGNSPRLRYQVDQDWFGELPRAYFYLDRETRLAHSGALTRQQLRQWLNSLTP